MWILIKKTLIEFSLVNFYYRDNKRTGVIVNILTSVT